jgi:DNA-binding transcriptional regulator GbsR (MarR family)
MKWIPETYTDFKADICRHMSLSFEDYGYSQLVGKIFSLLLFASKPMSLQEISAGLGVSRAAISVQIRAMVREGLCRKVPYSNDRRDYYGIAEDLCQMIIRKELAKARAAMQFFQSSLAVLPLMGKLESADSESRDIFTDRFTELSELYKLLASRLQGLEDEWRLHYKEIKDTWREGEEA